MVRVRVKTSLTLAFIYSCALRRTIALLRLAVYREEPPPIVSVFNGSGVDILALLV